MRHQLVHPLAHQSPVLFRNGERAAKVQQCLRTDLVPLPPALDQTVGHIRRAVSGRIGAGSNNKHDPKSKQKGRRNQAQEYIFWYYFREPTPSKSPTH